MAVGLLLVGVGGALLARGASRARARVGASPLTVATSGNSAAPVPMTGMTGGSTLSRGAAAAAAGTTHAGGGGTHEGAYSDIEVTDAAHGAMAHESNPLNLLAFASALKATGYAPLGAMLEAQAALYEA